MQIHPLDEPQALVPKKGYIKEPFIHACRQLLIQLGRQARLKKADLLPNALIITLDMVQKLLV